MRKRNATYSIGQRGGARGGARTMPRWLWAAMLVAAAGVRAWSPPDHVVLAPRLRRHAAHHTSRQLQLLGWHLELFENRAIRSPYYNECQFYKGRVMDEEESTATVTDCDGQLYGLLQVGNEEFVLEPTRIEDAHVLRRRDVMLSEWAAAYNLTGDTVTDLELDLEDDKDDPMSISLVRPRHSAVSERSQNQNIENFRGVRSYSRPVSGAKKGLWLEVAIVADNTMLKFHGKERVKHYILALMNIVSAIFNDPSLNSNMTLVINKLFLYEEKDYNIIKPGNAHKSLEAVNKWNYRHLMKLPAGSAGWDATVWLTRANIGGPSGYAPIGGICTTMRSAALDRDEGLTSAFVIAHELAHLLGVKHDDDSQCKSAAVKGSVMSPTVLATLHNYSWSTCSKEQFQRVTKGLWCLYERSGDDGVELGGAKEISNYVFTMDEQCRTEFGEGYSVCKSVKVRSACSRLWCTHRSTPNVCRSKQGPPLEGTPCGHNKWCVHRVCEPMPGHAKKTENGHRGTSDNRVDSREGDKPEWSEWSVWSKCSAECGYGYRTRLRRCRYKGIISETLCSGAGSQVKTCWAGTACAPTRDPRTDLCLRQHHRFISHLPTNESQQCEIWCVDYAGGAPSNFGAIPDGAACSYSRPFDVCFQGTCVKGQCNASDPVCNWCPDGYCNNNTHEYTRQIHNGWARMTMIPHDANQLSVHIATPVALNIAIRERKKDRQFLELIKHSKKYDLDDNKYLKYDPSVPQNLQIVEVDSHVIDIKEGDVKWEGQAVAAGSLLRWTITESDVVITSDSRLQTDVMIMAIPQHQIVSDETLTVKVSVNYTTPASRTRPLEYRWSTERGPCSASCGGGVRAVRPRCLREHKCPPMMYEACNTHSCEFTWAAGEWEECSATCGTSGVQDRQLYCVPLNTSTSTRRDLIRNSVSPALCTGQTPNRTQPCNRIQCPVYWREMPWTQCSKSCGRGVSRRPLECPASDDRLCGPKPRERHKRCRLRQCPRPRSPPRNRLVCPPKDTTQYCELFDVEQLSRHCLVPPFRHHCCNACRDVERGHFRGNG